MDIANLVTPQTVVANLKVRNKKHLLQELAQMAVDAIDQPSNLDKQEVFDVLLERERLGTTGVGAGIAVPHGKLSRLTNLQGLFARLDRPIDFAAIDEQPVDLVFLLLAPEVSGADHLKALARVSRLLRNRVICEKLRGANGADGLYAVLIEKTTSHAA